jgi:hypothetical protein
MSAQGATLDRRAGREGAPEAASGPQTEGISLGLRAMRVAWWVLVPLSIVIFVISLPGRYAQLQSLDVVTRSSVDILRSVDVNLVRASLQELNLAPAFYATYNIALEVLYASVFVFIAFAIFRRKQNEGVGIFVSLTLILFGTASIPTMAALAWLDRGWDIPLRYLNISGWILLLIFFYVFPDGRFTPRWTQPIVYLFVLWSLAHTTWREAVFSPWMWPAWLAVAVWSLWFVGGIGAEIYAYRKVYSGLERKQTKWVVYGMTVAVVGSVLVALPNILFRSGVLAEHPGPLYELLRLPITYMFVLILPVSILIAIVRANLFSIDLIINRTLVYVPLTAILAGLYSASISLSQRIFMAVTGEKSDAAVVITTLILASAFTPVKSGLQGLVDKLFKEVPDSTKGIKTLAAHIESDLAVLDKVKVTRRLLQETVKSFRASGGALYLANGHLKDERDLRPVHTYGEWNEGHTPVWLDLPLERKDGTVIGLLRLGPRLDEDHDARRGGEPYTDKEKTTLKEVSVKLADAIGA